MDDEEAAEFLGSYGLRESGLVRLIRKSYELLGLISFFTAGEDECRAWTIPLGSKAPQGRARFTPIWSITSFARRRFAGTRCSMPAQRRRRAAKGTLRLEGKEYVVQDGDVMHIRHSGCAGAGGVLRDPSAGAHDHAAFSFWRGDACT
jgi:ribosome-binding ATPase YchF (GTP1/OBG family)